MKKPYLFLGFPTAGDDSLLSLAALRLLTRLCVGCVCMSDSLKSLYVGPITDKSFNDKAKTNYLEQNGTLNEILFE